MQPLGPWSGVTRVAIAVSGGADSLCLAVLTAGWAAARGIEAVGLIVDHGLRPGSDAEAALTARRLAGVGVAPRILRLGLSGGSGLAERARSARYAVLTEACREVGLVDLLIGHHADDQAETVLMRRRARSGADGLAGMALLRETADLRLLRPLLPLPGARLRATLRAAGLDWVEDPSNRDPRALRTGLRRELAEPEAVGFSASLLREAAGEAARRGRRDDDQACILAATAMLRPEGFALLPPALMPPRALAALIRTVTGAAYPPLQRSVEALVRDPRPATLAGARLLPAGRMGPGWLLLREAAAMQGAVAAASGALWDRRFRLHPGAAGCPPGATIAAAAAKPTRRRQDARRGDDGLPASVLAVMPMLRDADGQPVEQACFSFEPASPAATYPLFFGTISFC